MTSLSWVNTWEINDYGDIIGTVELSNEYEGEAVFYWGSDSAVEGKSRFFTIDSDLKSGQTELHFPLSNTINPVLLKNISMKDFGPHIELYFELNYYKEGFYKRGSRIPRHTGDSETKLDLKFKCLLM